VHGVLEQRGRGGAAEEPIELRGAQPGAGRERVHRVVDRTAVGAEQDESAVLRGPERELGERIGQLQVGDRVAHQGAAVSL
jgi:hypothetical protein